MEGLLALGERISDGEVKLLQDLGLYKTAVRTDVRPLGLRNSLIKVFHKEAMSQSRPEIREFLEPHQLGMSKAGAAKLVNSVRGLINSRRDFVCIKIDSKNAFNEISVRSILETLESEPSLSHLSTFATILAPETEMETVGNRWGTSGQGVIQGDPPG